MKNLAKYLVILLAFATLPFSAFAASVQRIHVVTGVERLGGNPYAYLKRVQEFRRTHTKVVVRDTCDSSCTLYTALLPDHLICARPKAVFYFHQFAEGNAKFNAQGEVLPMLKQLVITPLPVSSLNYIWLKYPYSVRHFIMETTGGYGLPLQGPGHEMLPIIAKALVPICK